MRCPLVWTYVAHERDAGVFTGATVLTDATGDVQPAAGSPHIDYSVTGNTITAIVNQVATGGLWASDFPGEHRRRHGPLEFSTTPPPILITMARGRRLNGTSNTYNFTVRQSGSRDHQRHRRRRQ